MSADSAARQESPSDAQIRQDRLRDPEVQERLRQIHKQIDDGEPLSPGITPEELADFLSEQRKHFA
jgi:hypothetical protein